MEKKGEIMNLMFSNDSRESNEVPALSKSNTKADIEEEENKYFHDKLELQYQ